MRVQRREIARILIRDLIEPSHIAVLKHLDISLVDDLHFDAFLAHLLFLRRTFFFLKSIGFLQKLVRFLVAFVYNSFNRLLVIIIVAVASVKTVDALFRELLLVDLIYLIKELKLRRVGFRANTLLPDKLFREDWGTVKLFEVLLEASRFFRFASLPLKFRLEIFFFGGDFSRIVGAIL